MLFGTAVHGLRAIAFGCLLAGSAWADDLATPTGEVILTVSGAIDVKNVADSAELDMELLANLGSIEVQTSTIWSEGVHSYTGVPLKTLIDKLGVSGTSIKLTAINDYMVEVPVTDAIDGGPILAYLMDGQPMSVRDKGPVWLIYPFDSNPEYRSEVYYSRSIWQLNRIEAAN